MAYTDPVDPTPGVPIRATDQVTYVNDNIRYLFSGRPVGNLKYVQAGDMQYTANTFGIHNANLSKAATINSKHALVWFTFKPRLFAGGAGTQWGYFDLAMNGVRYGDPTTGLAVIAQNSGASGDNVSLMAIFDVPSSGIYTFTLHSKYIQGTATGGGITITGSSNADSTLNNMIIIEY